MAAPIQFWFDFASTYSYLSAMRIEESASAKGVSVEWNPFLLGPIFADQGWNNSPFNLYPAKGKYMWRDMERLCAARGLPLRRPDPFPQNGLKAARLVLAADLQDRAKLVCAIFDAEFGNGLDISDESVLSDCLISSGLPSDLMDRTQTPDIKNALFGQVDRAKTLGIFGAPSFIVGDELYWGDDRLNEALSYAATF